MQPSLLKVRRLALTISAAGGAALLLVLGFIAYCAYTLPVSHGPAVEAPPAATAYATAADKPFAVRGVYRGEPVTADRLPENLTKAVVAVEDRRFYGHHGIDLRGILRSAWHNIWRRSVEGGSTITQQLARLSYLSTERSLRRKVQEVMLAFWLESRLSKQEILARYLNGVYFGAGGRGGRRRQALFRQEGERSRRRRGGHAGRADPGAVASRAEPQSESRPAPRRNRA
jgi:penicillin-binding protein 1A